MVCTPTKLEQNAQLKSFVWKGLFYKTFTEKQAFIRTLALSQKALNGTFLMVVCGYDQLQQTSLQQLLNATSLQEIFPNYPGEDNDPYEEFSATTIGARILFELGYQSETIYSAWGKKANMAFGPCGDLTEI